ncbi:hypothetical protein ACFPRL_17890 [Pseudoclavibacter helvolus]
MPPSMGASTASYPLADGTAVALTEHPASRTTAASAPMLASRARGRRRCRVMGSPSARWVCRSLSCYAGPPTVRPRTGRKPR